MVWFYGIQAYLKWNGMLVLFKRKEFDPKILYHEFVMLPRTHELSLEQLTLP
jgi:hypothetical protein